MTNLGTADLLKVSLRLTLVQSAWTHTSMQSEGVVYCLAPALSKLYPGNANLHRILKHYQIPINTHPFLVSVMAGAILKMETEKKSTRTILAYVRTTMGPLAALGDPFFHGALAPLAAISASLITLLFGSIAGIITLLAVFNGVHLLIRISGLFIGYKKGVDAFEDVGRWIDSDKTKFLRMAASITGGVLIGLLVFRYSPDFDDILILAAGGVCIGISMLLILKRAVWIYMMPAFLMLILLLEVII
jgi:mannose/fructose/N-acetylgalactosamine-specific phosphotransferase system component IID